MFRFSAFAVFAKRLAATLLLWLPAMALPAHSAPLELSDAERAWLAAHPVIRLGIDPDWAPFEYRDAEGRYSGMASDYVRLLSERLGVEFQPQTGLSWAEVLDHARQGRLDVLPAVMKSPQREEYLSFTAPYLEFPMVIITRGGGGFVAGLDDLVGKRVAVVRGYVTQDLLEQGHPGLQLQPVTSVDEGLQVVALGEVAAYVGNLAAISYAIERLGLTNLQVAAPTPYRFSLGMGVRRDWPELASILDKGLASIEAEQARVIRGRWMSVQLGQGIDPADLARTLGPLLLAVVAVFLVIVLWNRRLRREVAERRAVERTLRRSEAHLLEAKERAEAANRAKSEFLAMMSHELRTPMNAVIGMGEAIAEGELSSEQRHCLTVQQRAAAGLLELLEDLLDLARIESGQVEPAHEPFDPRALVAGVVEILAPNAHGKGVTLSGEVAEEVPRLLSGDARRLRQILINLAGNAVKFTTEGAVEIRLTLSDGRLRMTVSDTGIGIPEAQRERIFEPFTQVDQSTTRQYGGTGLGLSIVRRLVELLGGRIGVASRLGEGSTFTVELPCRLAEAAAVTGRVTEEGAVEEVKGVSILLAEDAEDNVLLIRAYLKHTPHRLTVTGNGAEALAAVREGGEFDLVLMDMQMPVMDGYAATRAIRQWEREQGRPPLPILALTAHAMAGDERRSLEAGCSTHLNKPVRKRVLLEAIARYAA